MTATTMTRTAPDSDEIVRVVHLYTDGFGRSDPSLFTEAFHPDAWIFFTHADGSLDTGHLAECFADWATPPDEHIGGRIISVTQAGGVWSA